MPFADLTRIRPITRPAFDLGLWAACTAVASAIISGCLGFGAWAGGLDDVLLLVLRGTAVGGLGVGWVC
jgi:hypothetical protein